jgi:hypothetical protein
MVDDLRLVICGQSPEVLATPEEPPEGQGKQRDPDHQATDPEADPRRSHHDAPLTAQAKVPGNHPDQDRNRSTIGV